MTLYSYMGTYPQPLPNRIRMPDGSTRTGAFTAEEILEAGYVLAPEMPEAPSRHHIIDWVNNQWVITDTRTLEDAITYKLSDLKTIRRAAEQNFVFNGMQILLDTNTQGRINDAIKGFDYAPPGTTTPWEVTTGTFIEIDQNVLIAMGVAAWNHIRDCYINLKSISDAIQACTTIAEVDAIDLEQGWP